MACAVPLAFSGGDVQSICIVPGCRCGVVAPPGQTRRLDGGSGGATVLFVLHPFADKVRAGNDTEIATFPSH